MCCVARLALPPHGVSCHEAQKTTTSSHVAETMSSLRIRKQAKQRTKTKVESDERGAQSGPPCFTTAQFRSRRHELHVLCCLAGPVAPLALPVSASCSPTRNREQKNRLHVNFNATAHLDQSKIIQLLLVAPPLQLSLKVQDIRAN